MTAATVTLVGTPDRGEREVHWRDLAGLVVDRGLTPSYSQARGRAYVELDGTVVWASCAGVVLDPRVPGANLLGGVRLQAYMDAERAADESRLAALTDEQREYELAWRRAQAEKPDPPQWQLDAYCERHGIGEFR